MDEVFRALNDPHRRRILDLLREQDGRTSTDIEAHFPQMTRFGVMKHLKVLESALLLTTHKDGRFKYHYLNVVPLQEISDRWISRFAAPWASSLNDLKNSLEKDTSMTAQKPKLIFVTVIKTTPEKLWAALTQGQMTPAYYYGATLQTASLEAGQAYKYIGHDGQTFVTGEVLEAEAPKKLVMSFKGEWMPGMENDAPSRVTYEILQQGECCRLTLTHDGFENETATYQNCGGGWPGILSGLKTLLETGEPLNYNPMAA
jgi:uncharacterized protein YndB with AHSA1/START domain/DNA-binding transcriptional ArsR family regulator